MRAIDRRRHPRVRRHDKVVKLLRGTESAIARVETLSAEGLSITGGMSLEVGERIDLVIELARRPIVLSACTIRVDRRDEERTTALTFVDLPDRVRQSLERWVRGALDRQRAHALPAIIVVDRETWLHPHLESAIREIGRTAQFVATTHEVIRQLGDRALRVEAIVIESSLLDADLMAYLIEEHVDVCRIMLGVRRRTPDTWFHAILGLPVTGDRLRGVLDLATRSHVSP
jgi:hypothetical protein